MDDGRALLQVRGLTKAFGGALALDDVELTVLPGEVHGLLGENGSGKSTLIKILAAYYAPDAGELTINGREVKLPLAPGQSQDLGLEFVHQDLGLVPSLTVAENLFMREIVKPPNRFFVSWARRRAQAKAVFARYGVSIAPDAVVANIRPVERALVAIVRALEGLRQDTGDQPTLLVLDEPTVFLPEHEVALLFDLVREIAARGSSVLFVSHDLAEVRQITDRVTVLRDGRVAGTVVTADTTPRELVNLILGQELQEMAEITQLETETQPVVLAVRNLSTRWLHDMSFDLHAGEVLGLTGLVGSGYEDSVYAIFGAIAADSGSLVIEGAERSIAGMTPDSAMARRMALVPGDRQNMGSIPTLQASDNINLLVLDRYYSGGRLRQRDLDANAKALMEEFDVRPARPEMDYGSFSGGNQQKAMMAKWKQTHPKVMLLHEPTQGVDVGARQQIWAMIRDAVETTSTICASSDYEQLAAICDRVGVVARGRLVGFLTGDDVTKERIADFCLSASAGASVATAGSPDPEEPAAPTRAAAGGAGE